MSNRPLSQQFQKSGDRKARIPLGGLGRMLIVPVLVALKPKAAKWLSGWVSRKTTGGLAWISSMGFGGAVATEQWAAAIIAGVVALSLFLLELAASWAQQLGDEKISDRDAREEMETEGPSSGEIPRAAFVRDAESSPELDRRERNGFAMTKLVDALSLLLVVVGLIAVLVVLSSCGSTATGERPTVGEWTGDALERVSGVVSIKYQGGEVCVCVGVRDLFGGDGASPERDLEADAVVVPPVVVASGK